MDVSIFSEVNFLDSITIEITSGIQDAGEEFLQYIGSENIEISGNNTERLILLTTGSSSVVDFQSA